MSTTLFATSHFTLPTASGSTAFGPTSSGATSSGRPRPGQDQPRADATRPLPGAADRALVLGGGGSAGNAWLIGVIAGLCAAGLDVTRADLIIGTSAGATAAAQITSASPDRLLADILSAAPPRPADPTGLAGLAGRAAPTGPAGSDGGRAPAGPTAGYLHRTGEIIAAAADVADMRRQLGAAALELDAGSDGSGQDRQRATVAGRLPSPHWPRQAVLIVAVDAETGEPVVFDRHSGVDLADAVAASCATGFGVPPYRIGGRHFIDGGYRRSSENADLAAGYGRVMVLSPLGGRTRAPLDWGLSLAVQADELRAGGSGVETILPDSGSRDAFGGDMMNPLTRAPAARAGYGQGRALAGRLAGFWR